MANMSADNDRTHEDVAELREAVEQMGEDIARLRAALDSSAQMLERCVSYLADLNGSNWFAHDVGARDMRQRANGLQMVAYTASKQARAALANKGA